MRRYKHNCLALAMTYGLLMLFSCGKEASTAAASGSDSGNGGSTARFAVVKNVLYTVDYNSLNIFNISNPTQPVFASNHYVGFGIETIFPRDSQTLFLGSQTGMYIYNTTNPVSPTNIWRRSFTPHFQSCDPVVANDSFAFLTLNNFPTSNTWLRRCVRGFNSLYVFNVSDLDNVTLLKSYDMQGPEGLGLLGKNLFVCDTKLKWFDISNPQALQIKHSYDIHARDVIAADSLLILVGDDGLTQMKVSGDSLMFLSKIPVGSP